LTFKSQHDIIISTIIVSVEPSLGVREPVVRCEPVRRSVSNYHVIWIVRPYSVPLPPDMSAHKIKMRRWVVPRLK